SEDRNGKGPRDFPGGLWIPWCRVPRLWVGGCGWLLLLRRRCFLCRGDFFFLVVAGFLVLVVLVLVVFVLVVFVLAVGWPVCDDWACAGTAKGTVEAATKESKANAAISAFINMLLEAGWDTDDPGWMSCPHRRITFGSGHGRILTWFTGCNRWFWAREMPRPGRSRAIF